MRSALALLPLGALAACGSGVDSVHEAEVVDRTPTEHAAAAFNRFLGCEEEREDYARCYACDVIVHDEEDEGILVFATHWEHELKPWDGRDALQVSITGEVAGKRMTAPGHSEAAARVLFEEGIVWCTARGAGHDHYLKDEIKAVFGGSE